MSAAPALNKRTRLRAVYLTDTERDLLIHGMRVVRYSLQTTGIASERTIDFAKTFTCRRIDEVIALLLAVDAAKPGEQS